MPSILTKKQVKTYGPRSISGWGTNALIRAEVRYDDECRNGHNTFAITGDIYIPGRRDIEAGGCLHKEIAEHFPELAPYIKWHLCSSDGPMHYVANAVYHASNRDCWGKLKGEPKQWETVISFGDNPIKHKFSRHSRFVKFLQEAKPHNERGGYDFEVLAIDYPKDNKDKYPFKPKYTFGGYDAKWHECPFDDEQEALDFLTALQTCNPKFTTVATAWGEGKERDLDSARVAAIWPEATDEELTSPDLAEKLAARLPKLLEQFQKDVESLGFVF